MATITRERAKQIIRETFESSFDEGKFKSLILNLLPHLDQAESKVITRDIPSIYQDQISSIKFIGNHHDANDEYLDVYVITLARTTSLDKARTKQRNLATWLLKRREANAALIAYIHPDLPNWRFSFVRIDISSQLNEKGKVVTTEEYTPAKRFSFLVGEGEPSHTAQMQLVKLLQTDEELLIDDFTDSFSIEKVTKEFYKEIAEKFTKLVGGERKVGSRIQTEIGSLKLPSTNDDAIKKEFAVRLLGRLLFCWFLKKKEFSDHTPIITEQILSSRAVSKNEGYYHKIIEPLFFQVLNKPPDSRIENFISDDWKGIPFLNGSLFEPHHHDFYDLGELGLSKHLNTLVVPDEWLIELFELFEEYNFTIDESTSLDVAISVDPEMLGRIFENLLAEINPDTGETARKATGSYYTPRPIVEYMVDQSLKAYLSRQTALPATKLDELISFAKDDVTLSESEKKSVIDALDKVKIVDPACGSGAFPMGILQKMLIILQKVDPDSEKWREKILKGVQDTVARKHLEEKLRDEDLDYIRKLGIIQKSIYGVDIQPIATEISRLRCFLSLIVDQDEKNRIEPLPNLEFKFVSANTLASLPKKTDKSIQTNIFDTNPLIGKLKDLRNEYFISYGKEKEKIKKIFKETQSLLFDEVIQSKGKQATSSQTFKLANWEPFSDKASDWFDPEWMFGVNDGFDIVIANPPYGIVFDENYKQSLEDAYASFKRNNDIYVAFYQKGFELLVDQGSLVYISPNTFLNGDYFKALRNFITSESEVCEVLDFKNVPVFEDPTVFVCVFNSIKKAMISYPYSYSIRTAKNSIYEYDPSEGIVDSACDAEFKSANPILQKILEAEDVEILDNLFFVKDVGFNYWTKGKGKKRDGNSIGNRVLYHGSKNSPDDIPFLKGKNIFCYYHEEPENFLRSNYEEFLDKEKDTFRFSEKFLRITPKIIYRQTANRIIATIDLHSNYLDKTVHLIVPKPSGQSIDLKYLLALLNSSLFHYLYTYISQETEGRAFSQVKTTYVKKLPIKIISSSDQAYFVQLVDQIFELRNSVDYYSNQEKQRQLKETQNILNRAIFELYNLDENAISQIDGATSELEEVSA